MPEARDGRVFRSGIRQRQKPETRESEKEQELSQCTGTENRQLSAPHSSYHPHDQSTSGSEAKIALKDIIAHEENEPVLKQFCLFSALLSVIPLVGLKAVEYILRTRNGMTYDEAAPFAAAAAILIMIAISGQYAYMAYQQEKADYTALAHKEVMDESLKIG